MPSFNLLLLAGDGIGPEVMAEVKRLLGFYAKTGIAEYCRNLGAMYHGLAKEQVDPRPWGPGLVETIERQLRDSTPSMTISEQQAWRDRCLAKLTHLKRAGALAM